MGRRATLKSLAEIVSPALVLSDAADGWPGVGTVHVDGVSIPVTVWAGPIGRSHRSRDGVERRFQNPGSNRPIWVDSQRQPLLLGLWEADPLVGVPSPVVVAANPLRREGRVTRFSVFVNLAALQTAAQNGWAEHRNDDGELLRYTTPSGFPNLLLAGPDGSSTRARSSAEPARSTDPETVISLARSGLTLDEIGAEVGVSRERVRQVLNLHAPEVAAARKVLAARRRKHLAAQQRHAQAADRLHRLSEELLARGTDPTQVLDDLQRTRIPSATAERHGISRTEVLALYDASGFDFPFARRPTTSDVRFDHEACISYLRLAAQELGVDSLSAAAYEDFAARQTLTPEAWPSAQTIAKRFETWSEATEAAGLERTGRRGREYTQRFPAARCRDFVDRYVRQSLAEGQRPTLAGFDRWSKVNGGPSAPTLRNRLGRWSDVLASSFRRVEE